MRNGFAVASPSSVCRSGTDLSTRCRQICLLPVDRSATVGHVRVWIDVSNSPQVPFFRPLDRPAPRARPRRCASRRGSTPRHSSSSRSTASSTRSSGRLTVARAAVGKARAMAGRLRALRALRTRPRLRPRALARLARAADGRALARHSLRPTRSTTSSPRVQHGFGCRAARRIVVPDAIPQDRLDRLGRTRAEGPPVPRSEGGVLPPRLRARRRACWTSSGSIAAASSSSSGRRPTCRCTTARQPALRRRARATRLATRSCTRSSYRARRSSDAAIVSAGAAARSSFPSDAIDAQSLVALSDLVVSAGGTMNREAVALGVPVYTTFAGRLGAVDESSRARRPAACPAVGRRARVSTKRAARATPTGRAIPALAPRPHADRALES